MSQTRIRYRAAKKPLRLTRCNRSVTDSNRLVTGAVFVEFQERNRAVTDLSQLWPKRVSNPVRGVVQGRHRRRCNTFA